MAFTYGFYNSSNGDRVYDAEEFSRFFDGILNDGVFASIGDAFLVEAGSNMDFIVGTGRAWFNATWSYNDLDLTVTLAIGNAVYSRIDAIVLRIDKYNRTNSIVVIEGNPSAAPSKPTLSNTTTLHEVPLAYVTVPAGATLASQTTIELTVGGLECPYVTGIIDTEALDSIYAKFVDIPRIAEGRLTLMSGYAVAYADVVDAHTLYYTPYLGNEISLYDTVLGIWKNHSFSEISFDLTPLTTLRPYDIFVHDDNGTLVLSASVWDTNTSRSVSSPLGERDGRWVLNSDHSYLYLGTIYVELASHCTDSADKRFVWNMYNRVPRSLFLKESTDSWTYNSTTWRQVRATSTNRIRIVVGLLGDLVSLRTFMYANIDTAGFSIATAIGFDTTTTPSTGNIGKYDTAQVANGKVCAMSFYDKVIDTTFGLHDFNWLESGPASSHVATLYGDAGGNLVQSGVSGWANM